MILTTTNSVDGKKIKEYKTVVFGEVMEGFHFAKEWNASFTNMFGGRSPEYENSLIGVRNAAFQEMVDRAAAIGANAILGIRVEYELPQGMIMAVASGTAVLLEDE